MYRSVKVLNLGRMSYAKALAVQNSLADKLKKSVANNESECGTLIIVEHDPPVYTIGIRTKDYTLKDEKKLKNLGAEFYKTNRGGLITFHGLGQLVAYPILNLKQFKPSVKWYVRQIEKTVIDLCEMYNIKAETSPDTGVWVGNKKICAIGIHGSRYVTTHGLALNCNTDLNWFKHIVPCGIEGKGVTSLSEQLSKIITIDQVLPDFLKCFSSVFECHLDDNTNVQDGVRSLESNK